jgi:hypothetical protein
MWEYIFIDVAVFKMDAEFGKKFEEQSEILANKQRLNS